MAPEKAWRGRPHFGASGLRECAAAPADLPPEGGGSRDPGSAQQPEASSLWSPGLGGICCMRGGGSGRPWREARSAVRADGAPERAASDPARAGPPRAARKAPAPGGSLTVPRNPPDARARRPPAKRVSRTGSGCADPKRRKRANRLNAPAAAARRRRRAFSPISSRAHGGTPFNPSCTIPISADPSAQSALPPAGPAPFYSRQPGGPRWCA